MRNVLMLKGAVHEEHITILHVHVSHKRVWSLHEAKLNSTGIRSWHIHIIGGDFNAPLPVTDGTSRQKISKHTEDLNNTILQPDLMIIYRTLCPTTGKCTFLQLHVSHLRRQAIRWTRQFSVVHWTFLRGMHTDVAFIV